MEPYVVGQDRNIQKKAQMISEALRSAPGMQSRSDSTFYIPANGASPARIVNNDRGQMWNNIKDAVAVAGSLGDVYNAEQDKKDQSIALSQAAEDTGAMTPQKMMQLRNLGVDVETIKLMQGDKPDRLGQNQILQYGQTPAGMRAVNQLKPGTFSDEAIQAAAEAERAAHAQDVADKRELAIAGRAPSAGRAPTDFEMYQRDPEAYSKFKAAGKSGSGGSGVTIDADGNLVANQSVANSVLNQDRKYAQEATDLYDKATVQGDTTKRIFERIKGSADPAMQDKLAQVSSANGYNSVAEILRTPNAFANNADAIKLAISDARALAPVSNTDFDKLLSIYPTALSDPKAAASLFEELGRVSNKAQAVQESKAAFHNLRAGGAIPPTMTELAFKRRLSAPPAGMPDEDKAAWDGLTSDEKAEQILNYGGFK